MRGSWQSLVLGSGGALDRRAYTFCVLEQLRDALRRCDVFVAGSERWGDPFANLLDGAAWEAARPQICRTLDHDPSPSRELSALSEALDSAYRHTAARLPENGDVRIEGVGRRASIVVTALDKLEEPSTLLELRERVAALLPRVDLPELLLEVGSWTRFTEEFTNVSEGAGRVDDLTTSVCAVLIAEACNLGIEPLNAGRESRINDPPPALAAHTRPRCASRQNLHIIHHSHPALTPTDNEGWLRAAWLVSQCPARRSACR